MKYAVIRERGGDGTLFDVVKKSTGYVVSPFPMAWIAACELACEADEDDEPDPVRGKEWDE